MSEAAQRRMMRQEAPWPAELEALVARWRYRPGWRFHLADIDRGQGSAGLTLDIVTRGYNAYHPHHGSECPPDCAKDDGETYRVHHFMIVPAACYDARSWRRWLLDQCLLVDRHEAMEFARLVWSRVDGGELLTGEERPWAPSHGPGNDPYIVRELGTSEDQRTSFRGVLKDA